MSDKGMVHSDAKSAVVPTGLSAASFAILREAMTRIATERRYNGADEIFTVIPSFTGFEAMAFAQSALITAGLPLPKSPEPNTPGEA